MGLAASFIGLKGVDKALVLEALKAIDTSVEALPFEAPLAWSELNDGWLVLVAHDWEFASPERLALLSRGGQAVSCQIEEHVMASTAWGYKDGARVWSLDYYCERSAEVEVSGTPPSSFAGIYEEAKRAQAAETEPVDHIFDVPPDVFGAITGYRYGDIEAVPFTELRLPARVEPKRTGLLGLLFGRRSS